MSTPLLIEQRGPVDWVTLNRPQCLNALDETLIDALRSYFDGLYENVTCRVVVLRGAGRGFCAGADLKSDLTRQVLEDGPASAMKIQRSIRNVMLAMRRCPQPIIALVHGAAFGGGFVLALASDIRIAAEDARMNPGFIRTGLGGADVGISYLLPRLIGGSVSGELLLTGRDLEPARAYALGLVAKIVPADMLAAAAADYVDALLSSSPLALSITKEVLNANLDASSLEAAMVLEDRTQVMLSQAPDFRDRASAFSKS